MLNSPVSPLVSTSPPLLRGERRANKGSHATKIKTLTTTLPSKHVCVDKCLEALEATRK